MIKKILIPALITMLIFVASGICAYAEETDTGRDVLYHLGIIDDTYENYQSKKTITEKEFLRILTGFVTDEDIPADEAYNFALSQNIISRTDKIELGSAISYERALSLTLNILGYAGMIEFDGRDIPAVMKLAHENRLTKGLQLRVGDRLDAVNMIKLLLNALDAKVIEVGAEKNGVSYKKSDKTPLEVHRDIEKITAKVTKTADTSLFEESGVGKGLIGLGDNTYYIDYDYPEELLGQTVYAYIREDTVFCVSPRYDDIKKFEIKDEDIVEVADNFSSVTYEEEEDKTKLVYLDPALVVIYNGKNYPDYTAADLMPQTGKLVLLDTDRNNKYDIIYVYSYDTVVVKNVSQSYRTVTNLYSVPASTNILDLSDTSIDLRIYSEGKEASFSSILANDILSVAQSKGNDKIVTIYISKATVSGKISEVYDSEETVIINESEYKISDVYYNALAAGDPIDKLSVGSAYTCYLDVFGNIVFIKLDEKDGFEYAYLLKQKWVSMKGNGEDTVVVRLLNSEGDWEDVYYAEKVALNSQNPQYSETVYNSLGKDAIEPQLIMIKRDAEGKIKAVKTATVSDTYDPNSFTLAQATEFEKYYWMQDSSLNCRHYVKYDAKVFIKPSSVENMFNQDKYAVVSAGYFDGERKYKYLAYNVDEFGFPDVFVVSANTPGTDTTIYVNKIKTILNSDGQVVRAVVGNLEGLSDMTVQISSDFTDAISVGDVIEVVLKDAIIVSWNTGAETNSNLTTTDPSTGIGWARQYHLADATSPARPKDAPADDRNIHNNYRFFRGDIKALNVEKRMLLLDCGASGMIPVYIRDGANINIYNSDKKKYELKTISDIPTKGYAIVRMNGNNVVSVGIYE